MTIEKISSSTVKIVLSGAELSGYNMDFGMLDSDNPETKSLLISLLTAIENKVDIDLSSDRLFIEAFAANDGGCLLYISVIDHEKKPVQSKKIPAVIKIITEFDSLNHAIKLCRQLKAGYCGMLLGSQLYYNGKDVRLLIEMPSRYEKKLSKILLEYGKIIGTGEFACSATKEYFECIETFNALEKVSRLKPISH